MSANDVSERCRVRRFAPGDQDSVEALIARSPGAAQWPRGSYRNLSGSGDAAWVLDRDGKICAFLHARVTGDEVEILNLVVERAQRRAGLATAMLNKAIRELRLQGAQKLFLEVRESNQAARALYEKLGFAKIGRRPAYYRDPADAAVLMERILTG
jgi:[ribosomal protein S18]-alanine N-acetyltransferase